MSPPAAVVVMGPAASGKTTVARELARQLGWAFLDADDLHPPENVAKMAGGTPLDTVDRAPWLRRVAEATGERAPVVVACSALTRRARQALRTAPADVRFLLLQVPPGELTRRAREREESFFPPELVESQLAAFEPPAPDEEDVTALDGTLPPEVLVEQARQAWGL